MMSSSPVKPVTDTVYSAASPSFTSLSPDRDTVTASSVIVTVATFLPSDTPVTTGSGSTKVTVNFSSSSASESCVVWISIVFDVSPGIKTNGDAGVGLP